MKDNRAIETIEKLSSIESFKNRGPWDFGMYQLKKGFGLDHLEVFKGLANSTKLWGSKNRELHRIFMTAIGQILRVIAHNYPSALPETVQPRMNIIDKSRKERCHEPECQSSFSEVEIITLEQIAGLLKNEKISEQIAQIKHGYMDQPHYC